MIAVFLIFAFIAACPAVLIYWPFVQRTVGGSWSISLYLAALCQLIGFVTSWTTYLFMVLIENQVPAVMALWKLPEPALTFWTTLILTGYQMMLVPVISTLAAVWLLNRWGRVSGRRKKMKSGSAGVILWSGHILVGTLFFAFYIFVVRNQPY